MICPKCNKRMSEESKVFYCCRKCEITAYENNGGAWTFYNSDGTIYYPSVDDPEDLIKNIEGQIEEYRGKK